MIKLNASSFPPDKVFKAWGHWWSATIGVVLVVVILCARPWQAIGDPGNNPEQGKKATDQPVILAPVPPEEPLDEEYEVLRGVLKLVDPRLNEVQGLVLLESERDPSGVWMLKTEAAGRALKDVDPKVVTSFNEANGELKQWAASKVLKISEKLRLVERSALSQMIRDGGWPLVEKSIPGAKEIVSVSRPGFSEDRGTALICYAYGVKGPLSGGGAVVLMRKTPQGWYVDSEIVSFVH